MEYTTQVFFALSDPIRLRCLALLGSQGELCVCELTQALQASQPQISKHMATLRDAGLVRDRRDAQWVLYSLAGGLAPWAAEVVAAAVRGVCAEALHRDDVERLQGLPARPLRNRAA